MLHRLPRFTICSLTLSTLPSASCGGSPPAEGPILETEPPGAPVNVAEGRLSCLGNNTPTPTILRELTLPGYVRALADAANLSGSQPEPEVEAFDSTGSLGSAIATTGDGRVAFAVPIEETGFLGWIRVSGAGFVPSSLYSSRPHTSTAVAGWVLQPRLSGER